MVSKVQYIFIVPSFLMPLILFDEVVTSYVGAETVQHACPSKCVCKTGEFTGLSVLCSFLELAEIPKTPSSYSVQSLDLSYNKLTHIRELIFRDYRILETLGLSYNEINVVDSRAFSGLLMLKNIDLSYNNLRFIPDSIFADNPVLEFVSFRGNPLVYVPDSSPIFASTSVISLDLSFCALTSINPQTFSQLPRLQVLDLSSNNLREINQDILNPLTELIVIELGNNLWKCDCGIVEALNWLSERRRSLSLHGEHKPVKCVDAGVYKTLWTAVNKNKFCAEEARVISSTIPTVSSRNLEPKENKEKTPTAGSWWSELQSWNTVLVFILLTLMLVTAACVSWITVKRVIIFANSRRETIISSVSKNRTENLKTHLFSRMPLIPSSISSDSIAEKQVVAPGSNFEDTFNAYDIYHIYERID
jgi:hypothetical protein